MTTTVLERNALLPSEVTESEAMAAQLESKTHPLSSLELKLGLDQPTSEQMYKSEADEVGNNILDLYTLLPDRPEGLVNSSLVEAHWPGQNNTVLLKDETRHWVRVAGNTENQGERRPVAAFKRRGAWAATQLARLQNESVNHFVTASAGNHGLGVAAAAYEMGLPCTVYVGEGASQVKVDQMRALGANVAVVKGDLKLALDKAQASEAEHPNTTLVHPFGRPETLAGQATLGLDMLEGLLKRQARGELNLQTDHVDVMLPVGGGGLAASTAVMFKRARDKGLIGPNVRVIAVNLEDKEHNEWCDGTHTATGEDNVKVLSDPEYVQGHVSVSELEIAQAMHRIAEVPGLHKMIEAAGAVASAGVLHQIHDTAGDGIHRTYVAPVTGANVTKESFEYGRSLLRYEQKRLISVGVSKPLGRVATSQVVRHKNEVF